MLTDCHATNGKVTIPRRRKRLRRNARRRRGGWVTILLILSVGMIIGIFALVWTTVWLSVTHQRFRTRSEAGALAGAPFLMDDSCLYGGPGTLLSLEARIAAAKTAATFWMNQNGELVDRIYQNPNNDPDSGLAVGYVAAATSDSRTFDPWEVGQLQPVNTIRTHVERTENRGGALMLWFGRSLGVSTVEITVSAQASVDQRVNGFRPLDTVNVPMVPILAVRTGWVPGSVWTPNGGDSVAWDAINEQFQNGSDAIDEIKLTFKSNEIPVDPSVALSDDRMALLGLDGDPPDPALIENQIEFGLDELDLSRDGGQLTMNNPNFPMTAELSVSGLAQLAGWLNALAATGEERIWPIGRSVGSSSTEAQILGFAVARVVSAVIEDVSSSEKKLTVRLQPCLILTPTTLTHSSRAVNLYIGRVVMTR